ncbi:translocation and assembly module lipoprotein TamL [Pontibacter pamirensis]|uniref:translocation and assembly module lipoprotein TamL n=1 Tax=Pontibacter pamirensis TaxID=2562824 RepID=UPI001F0146A4|nr:BamA/TamA family outer membrane protein [Pontibacter pamirensis]
MKRIKGICILPLLLMLLLTSGCSVTKVVPEGKALFWEYDVKVKGENDSSDRSAELETTLSQIVRPDPNASILGLRPKLAIYNAFYTEKEKGVKHWIMTTLGEPPVLYTELDTGTVSELMSNYLHNKGYFNNTVGSTTTIENQKAAVSWTAKVGEPYRYRKIAYILNDSLPVYQDIEQTIDESLLETGETYGLETMTAERLRIAGILKNEGYYFFGPELLIFSADTTVGEAGERLVDVLLRVKNAASPKALRQYTLDDIYIFANYSLGDSLALNDTINYRGYHYIPNENYVQAKHLLRSVFLEHDSLYTREEHLLTTKRLAAFPAYKFVNIDYKVDTVNNDALDAFIYLTPALKKSLRAEAQMVNKSNGFAGPGLNISFRNRNTFRGSELLNLELSGTFESFVGGRGTGEAPEGVEQVGNQNLTSYEISARASLTFPRILSPFNIRNLRTEFAPQTRIGAGFSLLNRVGFFRMNSYSATYGYTYRPTQTLTFDVTPINLQYVQLSNTTDAFETYLERNPFLQRSFENQFIIGSIYQLTYSTQVFEDRTHQFFDRVILDLSGNSLNAFQSLTGFPPPTPDEPRTIAGSQFSQYVLLDNDFRHYLNIGKESQLVTRLVAGAGYAYGNSTTLPYVKQFSVGGPNSIRAFRARSIGPGTFRDENAASSFSFFDQVGDIRLVGNLEYRFPIAGFFKGAVFVDAGNIWTFQEEFNDAGELLREGGVFDANNFVNELAVGTGFGLRIDIEFFVIRLDLGIPVRVPYLPQGERFVLNEFNGSFSGENSMVLNIAIGYPF